MVIKNYQDIWITFIGSLAYTNAHLNRYWRMTMEVWVAIHAGIVAFQTVPNVMGKELWPMFFFGFTTAWIVTQVGNSAHGINLS